MVTYFPLRALAGRNAIAEADFIAALTLADFLKRFDVDVRFEFIEPDGMFETHDGVGTVVICGPKSSSLVAESLGRDEALRFEQDSSGAYLLRERQTGDSFYSRRDVDGSTSDIGYLARHQVTIGSRRTFISVAGIHAEGSVVVVDHLCHLPNLRQLHKRSRGELFSAVIGGHYTKSPLKIETSLELAFHSRGFSWAKREDVAAFQATQLPDDAV